MGNVLKIDTSGNWTIPLSLTSGVHSIRSTSQQLRLFPTTDNAETRIAFCTTTAGAIPWTMGQGSYGVGANNFGMGVSGTGTIGDNVLKVEAATGNFTIKYGLSSGYNNYAAVTGSFNATTFGANPTITVIFIKYNRMVTIIWPGVANTTSASNTVQDMQWSGAVPTWANPYAACEFPAIITNNNTQASSAYMYFSVPVSDYRINFWSVNSVSKAWAGQCSVDKTQWTYLSA